MRQRNKKSKSQLIPKAGPAQKMGQMRRWGDGVGGGCWGVVVGETILSLSYLDPYCAKIVLKSTQNTHLSNLKIFTNAF